MGRIQKAIDALFGREEPKVTTNNRRSVVGGLNNGNTSSLQSLNVGLNYDGTVRVGLRTHFALLTKNYIIASALRFLSNKVGGYGVYFVDNKGNTIKGTKADLERVNQFFSVPTFRTYIYETLAFLIASGQKVATITEANKFGKATNNSKIMNLDPRMLQIMNDPTTGNVLDYKYSNLTASKTFSPDEVSDFILYPDLDRDNHGQGILDSVVMEVLTDVATGNRQLYFYMNNATPGTVYIADGEMLRDESTRKDLETKIQEKYGGNSNVGKPLISTAIKDVKTIEIPDLDVVNEREHLMKIISMVFGIDPRVLGFMKDQGGSYAEIDAIARNMTNAKIVERAEIIEDIMNREFSKYVRDLPYKIKLDNILFKNVEADKKMSLEELKAGVITPEEYKELYDL